MKVNKYKVEYNKNRANKIAWVELNAKIYNLCLKRSPPDLDSVLKANRKWDTVMVDQDVICLLLVIQDITHKQNENNQSAMAYV